MTHTLATAIHEVWGLIEPLKSPLIRNSPLLWSGTVALFSSLLPLHSECSRRVWVSLWGVRGAHPGVGSQDLRE